MRIFAALPILTAVLAIGIALWPPARRFIWPVAALAAINVILTPLTSGEWFYQRTEDASYEQAVAKGDFTAFDRLLTQHDPHLSPRMIAMAVALLIALVGLAVLRARVSEGAPALRALLRIATGCVLLSAIAVLIQGGLLLAG